MTVTVIVTVTMTVIVTVKVTFTMAVTVKKVSSYIAQYPVLRTAQSALHFTSLADLVNQTPSQLLWEASSNMLQLMREGCSYTYPPLSTARYSFIQLSELEQGRVKKTAQGFTRQHRTRNSGPLCRDSDVLPRSHSATTITITVTVSVAVRGGSESGSGSVSGIGRERWQWQ